VEAVSTILDVGILVDLGVRFRDGRNLSRILLARTPSSPRASSIALLVFSHVSTIPVVVVRSRVTEGGRRSPVASPSTRIFRYSHER